MIVIEGYELAMMNGIVLLIVIVATIIVFKFGNRGLLVAGRVVL